ncbi:MAG TPA: winged helix-turn-helix domain-containing protein, partial [Ktedonobacteraceae bacterium]|nr:winged helix-turn-helix domain-containing protein [Ktedonobacteraceae bacterium]
LLTAEPRRQAVCDLFAELFDGKVRGIKPFGERDAYAAIEGTLTLTEQNMSPTLRRLCLDIAGAHPGLLKSVVSAFVEGRITMQPRQSKEHVIKALLSDLSVTGRCDLLWNSLSEIEQSCLKQMSKGLLVRNAVGRPLSPQQVNEAIRHLLLKGILTEAEADRTYSCFSALFAQYIAQRFPPAVRGLQLDAEKRRVWVDGVLQPRPLPKSQFRLLQFLASRAGEVCSRDETNRAVYGEAYASQNDAGRLDALVERTRKRIGDSQRHSRFIETVHGVGHRLHEYLGPRGKFQSHNREGKS